MKLRALFPCVEWLSTYRVAWLPADGVAGVMLAAYLIPVSLAYASLAGLPPQAGLYSSMLAGVAFAAFTSGRHTAIGVTSAISLLLGSVLAEMSTGDPVRQAWLASLTALYVGTIAFLARMFRAGSVVAFISETILAGFKVGVAATIAVSQLPKLLGVKASGHHFFEKALSLAGALGDVHWPSLLLGAGAIAFMALGERLLKNKPIALFAMIGSILLVSFTGLGERGIKLLGELPTGLPSFGPPPIQASDVDGLLALAFAGFLLATVETMAVGRTFALKHGYRVDANQEFVALGMANVLAGLGQGYPVSGGMSQSAVNESGGARTPLSLVVACALVGVVTAVFSGAFRNLPDPVLAAVVLMAIRGLVDVATFRRLFRFSRLEFSVAMVALGGVLAFGVLKGVLIAAVVSLVLLLRRAANPPILVLGRKAGSGRFVGIDRHPDAERVANLLVARVYGALLYFNVDAVRDRLFEIWRAEGAPPLVVLDMGPVIGIDLAGAKLLGELHEELARLGAELRLAETRTSVRHALHAAELESHPWTGKLGADIASVLAAAPKAEPERIES